MPLPRIRYRVLGQYDYMLKIDIEPDGTLVVERGDYTSHAPYRGSLDQEQRQRLCTALDALGDLDAPSAPTDAAGFMAELTIGEGPHQRRLRFWEGALNEQPPLQTLVRALALLG